MRKTFFNQFTDNDSNWFIPKFIKKTSFNGVDYYVTEDNSVWRTTENGLRHFGNQQKLRELKLKYLLNGDNRI